MTIALGFHAQNVAQASKQIGGKAAILNVFSGWDQPYPLAQVDAAAHLGAIPMITWMPRCSLDDIVNGKSDAYLKKWATAVKTATTPVYVRLMHEMNGGWYAWGAKFPGNTEAQFVAAWRYVVKLFRIRGVRNVQWVFCASTGGDHNAIANLFPGDDAVDWVAMDGYNRNNTAKGWRNFDTIFAPVLEILTSLSTKPVMIAETGCIEDLSDANHKADWITQMFLTDIPAHPQIAAALYFDAPGAFNFDWDTSPQALAAIKSVFASPLYHTTTK